MREEDKYASSRSPVIQDGKLNDGTGTAWKLASKLLLETAKIKDIITGTAAALAVGLIADNASILEPYNYREVGLSLPIRTSTCDIRPMRVSRSILHRSAAPQ
jgi:hypothetical protein